MVEAKGGWRGALALREAYEFPKQIPSVAVLAVLYASLGGAWILRGALPLELAISGTLTFNDTL